MISDKSSTSRATSFRDWLLQDTDYNWRLLASGGRKIAGGGDIGTHWMDTVSFILGAPRTGRFAHLETFHKTRYRPRGEVRTFAKADPATLEPYRVDTEDFGSVLMKFGKADHEFAAVSRQRIHLTQVAAGWKCSLALGIYGTRGKRPVGSPAAQRNPPGSARRTLPGPPTRHRGPARMSPVSPTTRVDIRRIPRQSPKCTTAPCTNTSRVDANRRSFRHGIDGHHEVRLCEGILRSSRSRKMGARLSLPTALRHPDFALMKRFEFFCAGSWIALTGARL